MISESAAPLAPWESFYVIVGSSAAALTGLQFVVMALIADIRRKPSSEQIKTFGTPNIVHFSAVLILSAVLSAPWPSLTGVADILALSGMSGLIYVVVTAIRARRQQGYEPVFEDWLWHVMLPFIAYAVLAITAVLIGPDQRDALFMIGGATLLMLLIGIHNAWDTVTFLVVDSRANKPAQDDIVEEPESLNAEPSGPPPAIGDA